MKGWKTKVGSVLMALAGGAEAGAQVCPDPQVTPWLHFAAAILAAMGAAFMGYGIGHKIETTAGNR